MHDLLEAAVVREFLGDRDVEVRALAHDSRGVTPGACFLCIPGAAFDGHDFAPAAVRRGARSLVVERVLPDLPVTQVRVDDVRLAIGPLASRFHGDPSTTLATYGITGTNGKTTSTYLLGAILEASGLRTAVIGTTGARLGGDVLPMTHTTPEATDLQGLLAHVRDGGGEAVAMEVSSHALDLHRVDGTRFAVVGFTNLTQDHLDYHGDLDAYFDAKARLFTPTFTRRAVVNLDDPRGAGLLGRARAGGVEAIGFRVADDGRSRGAAVWASDVDLGPDGSAFELHHELGGSRGSARVSVPLAGRFNVENALLAAAMALVGGCAADAVASGLASSGPVPGRMEPVESGQPFSVLVDYAHTPDALERVVAAARELAAGRVLLVFGCGGDRDRAKRVPMGVAAAGADLVWLTNDNPRSEDPTAIADDVARGLVAGGAEYVVELDRRAAIAAAIAAARPGDIVLIAGKGHESGQIFGTRILPFDDRDVARGVLAEVGAS